MSNILGSKFNIMEYEKHLQRKVLKGLRFHVIIAAVYHPLFLIMD